MQSWASASPAAGSRSGRFLKRAFGGLVLISALATAQTPKTAAPKKVAAKRANELTLAGLRPGRDTMHRAKRIYGGYLDYGPKTSTHDVSAFWPDYCRKLTLSVDFDGGRKIQVVRVTDDPWPGDCTAVPPSPWKTGHGLRLGDATTKVIQLYGEPDSRSPSTKDGQPLELWYYAFDWAGPDVPQVMKVLCTKEKEGQAGHVVEITLAAPSL
jgi:hypothetical protein